MNSKEIHLPNLDGLRFIGALGVLIFHLFTLGKESWGAFSENNAFKAIYFLGSKGHHGVGLFFVLSGFLIFYLLFSEHQRTGEIKPLNFLLRRILRIWPLYFLIVFFGFILFPMLPGGIATDHSILNYSFFLSNLDEIWNGINDPLNFLTISWSVSIEEQFYISMILLMILLKPLRKSNGWPFIFLVLILSSVIFRFFNAEGERVMYYHSLANISDLCFGGLGAWAVFHLQLKEFIQKIPRTIIVVTYLLGILMILSSSRLFNSELRSIEKLLTGSFFLFIILEQVYSERSFFKADLIPYFSRGGKLTYGIYMFHCIFIHYSLQLLNISAGTGSISQFLIHLLIVISTTWIIAVLSMNYFEGPILRLKRYFR